MFVQMLKIGPRLFFRLNPSESDVLDFIYTEKNQSKSVSVGTKSFFFFSVAPPAG